jgi:hypothetical protein
MIGINRVRNSVKSLEGKIYLEEAITVGVTPRKTG